MRRLRRVEKARRLVPRARKKQPRLKLRQRRLLLGKSVTRPPESLVCVMKFCLLTLVPLPLHTKPTRQTSFLIYFRERLPALKDKPEFSRTNKDGKIVVDVTAITSAVGAEWKTLSAVERERIDQQADRARIQYERDLKAWQDKLTPEDIRRQNLYLNYKRKQGKSVPNNLKPAGEPKRPGGAFFLFSQHLRKQEHPQGGAKWKALSAEERKPFEERAQQEFDVYKQRIEEYRNANSM